MQITYWSDYNCPYCYIAEARLRKAINSLQIADCVELKPRAFELDPNAPKTMVSDTASRFAAKYRLPLAEAEAQIAHISALGKAEGLEFNYATTRFTNTFDAHRVMKMALATGSREIAAKTDEALFAAYFGKNQELARAEVLIEAGVLGGLNGEKVDAMLRSDHFAKEVREDEAEAAAIGVRGVPYFIFPNGATVPGAISEADFIALLKGCLASELSTSAAGHQCGPNGCLI